MIFKTIRVTLSITILPGDGGFRRGGGGLSLLRRRSAGRMADRPDDGTTPVALMVQIRGHHLNELLLAEGIEP